MPVVNVPTTPGSAGLSLGGGESDAAARPSRESRPLGRLSFAPSQS
jgi:hypothetical protein